MKPLRFLLTVLLALVLLLAPSCRPFWRKKAQQQFPPTPIPPARQSKSEKVEAPVPPAIDAPAQPNAQAPPPSVETPSPSRPAPPPKPRRVKRGKRTVQPAVAEEQAAGAPPAGTVPPAPQPRLGEILSPEELREHVESYDRSLRKTRGMLTQISKHLLTAEQSQTAARIQTFLRQAEETRRPDLVAAVNLARRAELLAQDLLGQLP
jgi:hypothetical protein